MKGIKNTGSTTKMLNNLQNGGIVFINEDSVSWIENGVVYHLQKNSIKKLYAEKKINTAYLCGFNNEIKLNSTN